MDLGRFTDRSRRIVLRADDEARKMNHNCVDVEHVLIAVMSGTGKGVAAKALSLAGVTLAETRSLVTKIVMNGENPSPPYLPITPAVIRIFTLASQAADDLKREHVATEHLLLGLIRELQESHWGATELVLNRQGVSLDRLHEIVLLVMVSSEAMSRADLAEIHDGGSTKFMWRVSGNMVSHLTFEMAPERAAKLQELFKKHEGASAELLFEIARELAAAARRVRSDAKKLAAAE